MPRSIPARDARDARDELLEELIWGTMVVDTVYVRFMVIAATRPRTMKMPVTMRMVLRPSQRLLTRAIMSRPSSSSTMGLLY